MERIQGCKPLIFIGVTGGTASGKTSLCRRITERIKLNVTYLSLDSFYKGLSEEDHNDPDNYNFDHPNALDFDLAYETVLKLLRGEDCDIPIYDFSLHARLKDQTEKVRASPIFIFEGILALYDSRIRELMDIKIFVLTDDDIRLLRRLLRDCSERGRTVEGVLKQYNRFVKTAYDDYIKPTMKYANIIVPFGSDNTTAIDFIVTNLTSKVHEELTKRRMNVQSEEHVAIEGQNEQDYITVSKSLGFEIVDYAIDYIGFKAKVSFFKPGNQENFKNEIMIRQIINYESASLVDIFINSFQQQLKTLYNDFNNVQSEKKVYIQNSKTMLCRQALQNEENRELIKSSSNLFLFYPEILDKTSLEDLIFVLDEIKNIKRDQQNPSMKNIVVLCFFFSVWALQELKNHELFKNIHFYVLSLNDKLREFSVLKVMEEFGPQREEWERMKKQEKIKALGGVTKEEVQDNLNAKLCYDLFFKDHH